MTNREVWNVVRGKNWRYKVARAMLCYSDLRDFQVYGIKNCPSKHQVCVARHVGQTKNMAQFVRSSDNHAPPMFVPTDDCHFVVKVIDVNIARALRISRTKFD